MQSIPHPRTCTEIKIPAAAPAPTARSKVVNIADYFRARRVGPGRYQAKCPAHDDQSPSLSIREADDGRILLICRAGCRTRDVLSAAGLRWADLFPGPPPSPEQQAAADRERDEREAARLGLRLHFRTGARRLRSLNDFVTALAPRLMVMPDGKEADKMTRLYHESLDEIRRLDCVLDSIERCLQC